MFSPQLESFPYSKQTFLFGSKIKSPSLYQFIMPLQHTALFSASALMPPSDHHHTKALLTAVLVREAPGHWLFHGLTIGLWWQHVDLFSSCCQIPELTCTGNWPYAIMFMDNMPQMTATFNKTFFGWHRGGYETASRHFVAKDLSVDLDGRSFMITGANSGIGKATATAIARKGQWRVPTVEPSHSIGSDGRYRQTFFSVLHKPCAQDLLDASHNGQLCPYPILALSQGQMFSLIFNISKYLIYIAIACIPSYC